MPSTRMQKNLGTLSSIRQAWASLSPLHPHREVGLRILDRLPHLQFGSLTTGHVSFKSNLTPAHIFRDLYAQKRPRYRNQLHDFDDDTNVEFCDFVAGWVALAHDSVADVTDPSQASYSVSNVVATSKGLGSCEVQWPLNFLDEAVVVRPLDTAAASGFSNASLTSTLSPAGSVTDPHIDGTGSQALLFQLFGTKLLFTWPASSDNLEWMVNQHGIKGGPLVLPRAIEEMSHMCVTILTPHQSVVLDSGMIHAVMSPNNSAISGWDFVDGARLETDDVQRQMLWEADLVKKQKNGSFGDFYDFNRYLEEDLELWDMLAEKTETKKSSIKKMIEVVRAAM